jgi:hypothetical protein
MGYFAKCLVMSNGANQHLITGKKCVLNFLDNLLVFAQVE